MFAAHSYLPIVDLIISKPLVITFWVITSVIALIWLFKYISDKETQKYQSISVGAFVKFKPNKETTLEGYLVKKYPWDKELLIRTDNLQDYRISLSDVTFFWNRDFHLKVGTYWKTNSEELMFVKQDNGDGSYVLLDPDGYETIYISHFAFNANWDLKNMVCKEDEENEILQSNLKKLVLKEQTLKKIIKKYSKDIQELRTELKDLDEEYWEIRKEHKKVFQTLKKFKNFTKNS